MMIADATIMATTFGLAAGDMIRRCERFRRHIQQTVPRNFGFCSRMRIQGPAISVARTPRSAGRGVP
jgi:hypothetical protein